MDEIYRVYVVTAEVEGSGIIVMELFEDCDDALQFQASGLDSQIRTEYGDVAADHPSLTTGFSTRKLHPKTQ